MGTRADVRSLIRGQVRLWPDVDAVQNVGGINSSVVSVTISDGTRVKSGFRIQIDDEVMFVRSISSHTLTVRRGDVGTTPAAHAQGATVHIFPEDHPTDVEINRWIAAAIEWLYPICCLDIWDSTTETKDPTAADALWYAIPGALETVEELWLSDGSAPEGRRLLNWWRRDGTVIRVPCPLPPGRTLQFHGKGRFPVPTSDTTDLGIGPDLEQAVVFYVASLIVKAQEIKRTRFVGYAALLEARAGNVPDMIGSSRDLFRIAASIRDQQGVARGFRLQRRSRHGQ